MKARRPVVFSGYDDGQTHNQPHLARRSEWPAKCFPGSVLILLIILILLLGGGGGYYGYGRWGYGGGAGIGLGTILVIIILFYFLGGFRY